MESLGDWLLHLYDDPTLGITIGIVLVLLVGGAMWSKNTLIDLLRGKWFQ
jgi:hypothetical protein